MYTSSIINKYGDASNITKDVKVMNEILDRQGHALFIDVIAEYAGKTALDFRLGNESRENLRNGLITLLKEAINERI